VAYLHSLVIGLTVLGLAIDTLIRRRPLPFSRHGQTMRRQLIRRTRLWVGGRRKEDDGSGCYTLREVGYIKSAVGISSIHSMFGWTTNSALPRAGAEYYHPAKFTCYILGHIRYAAHRPRAPSSVPYPFTAFYKAYCIFIPGILYRTQYLQRHNLHFSNSSPANERFLSLDSAKT
jgi:hypothetical protein